METYFWTVWLSLYHIQSKAPCPECGMSQRRSHTSLCWRVSVRVLADSLEVTAFHGLALWPQIFSGLHSVCVDQTAWDSGSTVPLFLGLFFNHASWDFQRSAEQKMDHDKCQRNSFLSCLSELEAPLDGLGVECYVLEVGVGRGSVNPQSPVCMSFSFTVMFLRSICVVA